MTKERMRILQIGAGSMGTRRLRDLSTRPDVTLALLDERADRRAGAKESFSIPTFDNLQAALAWGPEAIVISTPPDQHDEYIELAMDKGLHHFCEAQLWTYDFRKIENISAEKGLVSASSCSCHFLPMVRELKKIVSDELGELHAYQMMLSTYMPTWHPTEGDEFYARHRHTAAAREMVPFELLYLNHVFTPPVKVAGSVSRRGNLDNKSEDTWCLHMNLENGATGQLMVLQASPSLVRTGYCLGTNGSIRFDMVTGKISTEFGLGCEKTVECGSQKDVIEATYSEEINTFVEAILGRAEWPHPYYASSTATATLAAAEKSAVTERWEKVDPIIQPGRIPPDYAYGWRQPLRLSLLRK